MTDTTTAVRLTSSRSISSRSISAAKMTLRMLLTLTLVSVLVFAVTQLLPGDVAQVVLGQEGTPEQLARLRQELGLDAPVWLQYAQWIGGVITGDFGSSLASGNSVNDLIGERVLNSVTLVVLTMVVALPAAVIVGTLAANFRGSAFDKSVQALVMLINALPMFVVGALLVVLFATTVFPVLPAVSNVRPGTFPWENPVSLILPVATLALLAGSYIASLVRTTVIDALNSEYAMLATLKGLHPSRILFRHALSNAVGPILQASSIATAITFGSVVVVEYVFAYPGIGTGLTDAIGMRDIPVIQAYVLLIAAVFYVGNAIADFVAGKLGVQT